MTGRDIRLRRDRARSQAITSVVRNVARRGVSATQALEGPIMCFAY